MTSVTGGRARSSPCRSSDHSLPSAPAASTVYIRAAGLPMTEFGPLDEGLHQPSPDSSTPQSLGMGPSVG